MSTAPDLVITGTIPSVSVNTTLLIPQTTTKPSLKTMETSTAAIQNVGVPFIETTMTTSTPVLDSSATTELSLMTITSLSQTVLTTSMKDAGLLITTVQQGSTTLEGLTGTTSSSFLASVTSSNVVFNIIPKNSFPVVLPHRLNTLGQQIVMSDHLQLQSRNKAVQHWKAEWEQHQHHFLCQCLRIMIIYASESVSEAQIVSLPNDNLKYYVVTVQQYSTTFKDVTVATSTVFIVSPTSAIECDDSTANQQLMMSLDCKMQSHRPKNRQLSQHLKQLLQHPKLALNLQQ
uniref:Uncharacterized protein n=1 Tax=Romanomermis culicivorax TaxID=13658 RepID=A0A915KW67_ROMCU